MLRGRLRGGAWQATFFNAERYAVLSRREMTPKSNGDDGNDDDDDDELKIDAKHRPAHPVPVASARSYRQRQSNQSPRAPGQRARGGGCSFWTSQNAARAQSSFSLREAALWDVQTEHPPARCPGALGLWLDCRSRYGRALGTGTEWAGLHLIHHH